MFIHPVVEFFCGDGYSPLKGNQHKIPGTSRGLDPGLTFEKGKNRKEGLKKGSIRLEFPSFLGQWSLVMILLIHRNQRQNSHQVTFSVYSVSICLKCKSVFLFLSLKSFTESPRPQNSVSFSTAALSPWYTPCTVVGAIQNPMCV